MAKKKEVKRDIPPSGGVSLTGVTAHAEKTIQEAKQSITGARGIGNENEANTALQEELIRQKILEELQEIYSPNSWRPVISAPADMMHLATGRDIWKMSKEDSEALSIQASRVAKYFLIAEPKWVALIMFLTSLSTIYGTKIAMHISMNRKEAKEKS